MICILNRQVYLKKRKQYTLNLVNFHETPFHSNFLAEKRKKKQSHLVKDVRAIEYLNRVILCYKWKESLIYPL